MSAESKPGNPAALTPAPGVQHIANQADPVLAAEEAGQMLDVKIPHVHAPHGEVGGWRGFATHVAIIAVGLLLALGMEQAVEGIHHEFQRATLESQMRETFKANLRRIESDTRVLNGYRSYLTDLKNAVRSRIAGGSVQPPMTSDPRNNPYAPAPSLGSYEAAKSNGSVGLLSLNRIRLYNRIEFQHGLMLSRFQLFLDSTQELSAFVARFTDVDGPILPQPDIAEMSAAQLLEYQALLAKVISNNRFYVGQLQNLKVSYGLMLRGVDDVDTLMDGLRPPKVYK